MGFFKCAGIQRTIFSLASRAEIDYGLSHQLQTGVEEFLADRVIVLYNLKHENVRENAIEILKLRGASHKKSLVAMQITDKGIVVYPEQEVFAEL